MGDGGRVMAGYRPRDWHVLDLEKDPTPGDPDRVRYLARVLHDFADDVSEALRLVKGMAEDDVALEWAGKSAAVFKEQFSGVPKNLKKLKKSYELCGDALAAYWPKLERAQALADKALAKGREARDDLSSAQSRLVSADSWVTRAGKEADKYKDDPTGSKSSTEKPDEAKVRAATRDVQHAQSAHTKAQSDVTGAQDALDAAKKMAADARTMREEAAREAKSKIDEASDAGIQNRSWWEEVGDWFEDNWDTIVTVCKVVVAVLGIVAMIIGGPILGAIVLVAALVVLADTLYKYSKGQASLWDVGFAALDCIPGMKGLTTLGGLAKGLKGGAAAVKGLKGGMKGMSLAVRGLGKNARGMLADGAKGAYDRLASVVRRGGSDPVDMATGKMFLPQSDVELPGLLPLVFERRVESGYATGWWFGPTWASTIDQRLETDENGVVFVTEDGLLLAYPHPDRPNSPVLPHTGPRWPLSRLDDGGYTVTDPVTGHTRRFATPSDGLAPLERISDRNGHTIDFHYDTAGTPTDIRHSGGYHLKLTAEDGRITALALAGAAEDGSDVTIKRYGYTDGNLTEVVNSSNLPLRFTYDERLRITSWTDTNDSRYEYTYDAQDRCIAEGGEAGHIAITLDYDGIDPAWPDCRVTTLTTAEGAASRFVINDHSQVVAEIDANGGTTRTEYDHNHHVVSRTDALGHTTRFTNDTTGRPLTATHPDGEVTRYTYNDLGRPTTITLAEGSSLLSAYDERGNRTAVTDAAGATIRYAYDDSGRLTAVTDALGATTSVRCTAAGLVAELTDPLDSHLTAQHDAFGRVAVITDPLGAQTRRWWTVEGRLARLIGPDGAEQSWVYDGEGNCIRHTDAGGGVSSYEYTHFDLLTARTGPDGVRYEFEHDASLRLTKVTAPHGLTWEYEYDPAGRLVAETDFDDRRVTYTRDAAGRVVARTNPLGQSVAYDYDALGRLASKNVDGAVTRYEYDSVGRRLRATSPDSEMVWERDETGRPVAETVNGRTLSFRYDAAGRRTERTTPTGARAAYGYDAAGHTTSLITSGHALAFTYDAAGREISRLIGDSLSLGQGWDTAGRLTDQTVTATQGTVQRRSYAFRPDNSLVGIDDPSHGEIDLDLDDAGRVTGISARDWAETYAYDAAGNQTRAAWPGRHPGQDAQGDREYTGNRLTQAGSVRYEYDRAGRIVLRRKTRLSRKPDVWRYEWDAEDRLTSVTTPDGTMWCYRYDPFGRRTAKQRLAADGVTVVEETHFTWDGPNVTEQTTTALDLPHPVTLTWDHDGLFPVAQTERLTNQATQEDIDSRFFAIVTDLVGTPTELVDETGNIAWRSRRTLWGVTTWQADSTAYTPLRFPGQYHDHETGLHYNYFRHYDPETGRYLSSDPLGLEPAPNPSTYVNNPHTRSDPLGLSPYPNEHLADLPVHSRYDRFYVRAGELVDNRIASHPLTEAQMYGGEMAGHGGVRNLPNEDLTRFGGPQGNDPISGYRDWAPGDSTRFPGSQIHITGGHHRTAEIVRRIGAGEMDPSLLIEFAIRG
ncbi:RHS repeat-associated core domain-containing protein [Streptomyces sp. NPDC050619]|uniref:RHS repeat-associated core domain-containing protein n=1 Tax=Streptomyces sp. NPDC050619 TaxID=3157214 RepID=UPI00343B3D0E